jgi:hypothetical protein
MSPVELRRVSKYQVVRRNHIHIYDYEHSDNHKCEHDAVRTRIKTYKDEDRYGE